MENTRVSSDTRLERLEDHKKKLSVVSLMSKTVPEKKTCQVGYSDVSNVRDSKVVISTFPQFLENY